MVTLKAYAFTLVAFFSLDFLWLGFVARGYYASQLGSLMRDNINLPAAAGFYVVYVAGILFFAVLPALNEESWMRAIVNGAFLGLLAYGTYDMTNIATLRNWPVAMSVVDIAWGTVLTAGSAWAGYMLTRIFN